MYLPTEGDTPVALIERALHATIAAEPVEAKLKAAGRAGTFDARMTPGEDADALAARAVTAGVISAQEGDALVAARELTEQVIRVDDFPPDLGASMVAPAAPVTVHDAATLAPRTADSPRRRAVA